MRLSFHTHYWYEVGMLKVPAVCVCVSDLRLGHNLSVLPTTYYYNIYNILIMYTRSAGQERKHLDDMQTISQTKENQRNSTSKLLVGADVKNLAKPYLTMYASREYVCMYGHHILWQE